MPPDTPSWLVCIALKKPAQNGAIALLQER
jgi:hypothetical protein